MWNVKFPNIKSELTLASVEAAMEDNLPVTLSFSIGHINGIAAVDGDIENLLPLFQVGEERSNSEICVWPDYVSLENIACLPADIDRVEVLSDLKSLLLVGVISHVDPFGRGVIVSSCGLDFPLDASRMTVEIAALPPGSRVNCIARGIKLWL